MSFIAASVLTGCGQVQNQQESAGGQEQNSQVAEQQNPEQGLQVSSQGQQTTGESQQGATGEQPTSGENQQASTEQPANTNENTTDITVKLFPDQASPFHDTDGDGLGEFEGWGTSLCWWANRVGYDETLTAKSAELFFGDTGLDMNIGRYNIGGGDLVGERTDEALAGMDTAVLDTFLHPAHITRSDSVVPGYAVDVTAIVVTEDKPLSWYEENFARADAECGYAWNYDWEADANQMAVLLAAAKASGEDFHGEAFSNSPPYFMTNSGCSSGARVGAWDNLRPDSYNAFAAYMADVIEHWHQEGVITFKSVSPMNEPYTDYWSANSNKQEGCHFNQGKSQSNILVALHKELQAKGIDILLCGTDETSIDVAITSYNKLTDEAKAAITRIDTHSYKGGLREKLKNLAVQEGKNLWMSEVDGSFVEGTDAGEMGAALGLAKAVMLDLNEMKASAWILWNAIDMHVDSAWADKSSVDYADWESFDAKSKFGKGFWGIAVADHNAKEIALTKKYYAYGQFSRYIRPGYTIIGSDNEDMLVAYDPKGKKVVIVAVNTAAEDKSCQFDLSAFAGMGGVITAIRTSGSMENGENWADVSALAEIDTKVAEKNFTATLKGNSITTFIVEGVDLVAK